jgi:hypothetical protein
MYDICRKCQHVHHLGLLTPFCSTYKDSRADPHIMTIFQDLKQLPPLPVHVWLRRWGTLRLSLRSLYALPINCQTTTLLSLRLLLLHSRCVVECLNIISTSTNST